MKKKNRRCFALCMTAILLLSIAFFLAESCREPEPELVPIGEARIIQKLENGNFEVTPAFIIWAKFNKDRTEILELELKKCQELKEKK